MASADTRPPLYLTRSDAVNWTRFHPEDIGREIIIVEWEPAPATGPWPPRQALGRNSRGEWVWLDAHGNPEGVWP